MKKALKRIAITLALIVGIPLLVLVVANLRDEALDPAAAAFISTERPRLPDEQNAYYHLAGFAAAPAENPHAAGRTWLVQVHSAQAKQLAGEDAPWPAAPKGSPKLPALCAPERGDAVSEIGDLPRIVQHGGRDCDQWGGRELLPNSVML